MNAMTIIEPETVHLALPDDLQFTDWVALGRDLFTRHRNTEWMLADWLKAGTERFPNEAQLSVFLDEIGFDRKEADEMAKVSRLIPETWRSDRLSFDVCRKIAKIEDEPTRQRMIKQAVEERWNVRSAKFQVMGKQIELGQIVLAPSNVDDPHGAGLKALSAQWNRVTPAVREEFLELAEEAGTGVIEV